MTNDLKKIWAIFTPAERRKSVWMLILVALMALAETGGVLSIMPFLSVLGRPDVIHQNHWLQLAYDRLGFEDARSFLIALGLVSIATVLGSSVFKTIVLHLLNRFIHLLRHSVSARLLSRYLRQPYEFFLTRNPSVLSRNVLSEVDQLLFNLIQPLSQLIAQGAVVLAVLLLVFLYNPLTALAIVMVVGLLYGGIYGLVRKRLVRIGTERQAANAHRFQSCNEVLGGIKDVKVTHAAMAYQEKFNRASRQLSRHMATSDTLSQSPLYLVEAVGYCGLILLALVLMLNRGDIAHVLPALGLYGFAAYRLLPSAQIMYRGLAKLKFSSAALDSVHHDLVLPDDETVASGPMLAPRKEIRLQNIRYAYPSTPNKPVLDHLNLHIPAGTSVGIVGKTGAGKSTLMDILLGLLQPRSGTLYVDDTALDAGNVAAWQRAIGYVPQHIYLADASVAENIAFGVARKDIDMAAVQRAARAAQIHDFVVDELKDGYDTSIGDRGIRLSGGQRQRIGIARALYRDPPVLFMDEATSALDGETEDALNESIQELSDTKTILVIAHKESSLKYCKKIVHL
ncbi:ABC transporter ATP-binding protein [Rhodanobacter sp. Root480]|uniref:ABC transporter ATP-binding protein n=1 Tax=Rhodanobacter sp. Root480 TaxID=1736542 RepID=UPI0006FA1CC9|nr:ABC transporter ATP-binding protein [Rhodanobacter sp. Root480]KQX98973.1 ABC transporter ATP-binding protein [Rhodanobacter sp. Root480]